MMRRRRSKYVRKSYYLARRRQGVTNIASIVPKYGSFKLRVPYNITTAASTGAVNYAFRITRPDNIDASGTALTDWSNVAGLYDQFRVTGIGLKWIPCIPNDSSTSSSAAFRPLFVFMDVDDTALSPTNSVAIAYDNCRTFDCSRVWKRYFKIPPLKSGTSTPGKVGWFDTASPQETGAIYLTQTLGFIPSYTIGTLILTYYIKTYGRN